MNRDEKIQNLIIAMFGSALLFTPFVYIVYSLFGFEWKVWQIIAVFIFLSLSLWGFVNENDRLMNDE